MNQSKILTLTVVVAVLSLSACGKKKEEAQPIAGPAPATPGTTQPTVDGGNPKAVEPARPQVQAEGSVGATSNPGGTSSSEDSVDLQRRSDSASSSTDVGDAQETPDQKKFTGARNERGLLYTGSSSDGLLEKIRQLSVSASPEAQARHREAAQALQSVSFQQDPSTKEISLEVRLKIAGRVEKLEMSGELVDNLPGKLLVHSSSLRNSKVRGQVRCLDVDIFARSCANLLLTLEMPTSSGRGQAQVILRESVGDLHFQIQESSGNPEFEQWRSFLVNSVEDGSTKEKIRSLTMKAFETVGGVSGFEIQMIGENRQYIGFRGELVSTESGTGLNENVQRVVSLSQEDSDRGLPPYSLSYQNTLNMIRLVKNNSRGQLRFKFGMRPYGNYRLDHFQLSITRRQIPVIELSAEQLQLEQRN